MILIMSMLKVLTIIPVSSLIILESGMVHYKNCIGLNDIITKRGQNGMIYYKKSYGP